MKRYEPGIEWIRDGEATLSNISELGFSLGLTGAMEDQWDRESSGRVYPEGAMLALNADLVLRYGGWVWLVPEREFLLTLHNMCTSLPHPGPCPSKHLQVSVLFLSELLLKISSACSHSDGSQWPTRCSLILLSEVQSRERLGGGCMYSNTGAERKEIEEGIQI